MVSLALLFPNLKTRQLIEDKVVQQNLPKPIFPSRIGKIQYSSGRYFITFLNKKRTFQHPFCWHSKDLAKGTRLWKLNLHYMEFLEELNDPQFISVINDWIDNNPPYTEGYWLDSWNSYALSIRCVLWMQQYAIRESKLPDCFKKNIVTSLWRQIQFLEKNLEVDIGGNHLIGNIKALLWAGRFFDDTESNKWKDKGIALLRRELEEQILEDGFHFERSPSYHCQVFADLLDIYSVIEQQDIRSSLQKILPRMAQVVADMSHPDGSVSLFNDGGLCMTYSPSICLGIYNKLIKDNVSKRVHIAFVKAGYYGLRLGNTLFLADCGQIAPDFLMAHGHGDILSFEWSIQRKRIVVDAGVFGYDPGYWRVYSRSTAAHNTVTLDDVDQCEFWSSFRVARRANVECVDYRNTDGDMTLTGYHDGYKRLAGNPIHKRSFHVTSTKVEINDVIENGHKQKVQARLLLHPKCKVRPSGKYMIIERGKVRIKLQTDSKVSLHKAWYCPDFGVAEKALCLVIDYGLAPTSGMLELDLLTS